MDIQRYLKMVTSQHQNKPKFLSWLAASLTLVDDVSTLVNVFDSSFDIDLATGSQLEIIGKILGVSRLVNFQPTDGSSPMLDDNMYRLILKARILQNQWDGTMPQMQAMWKTVFSDAIFILKDNQDMTLEVLVIGLSTQMERDLTTNGYIIPKPQGVSMIFSYSDNPFFAYGVDTNELKGFGEGYWAQFV